MKKNSFLARALHPSCNPFRGKSSSSPRPSGPRDLDLKGNKWREENARAVGNLKDRKDER